MYSTCRSLNYVTYNPDYRDIKQSDKTILAITNLETWIKKNKPKKCSVQYVLSCSHRLGRLKRQQASDKLRFLHRSYMRGKQSGWFLLRENQARQLSKPLTALRCSYRWPSNHGTMEPSNRRTKNLKWIKNMVCCRLMPGSNKFILVTAVTLIGC